MAFYLTNVLLGEDICASIIVLRACLLAGSVYDFETY